MRRNGKHPIAVTLLSLTSLLGASSAHAHFKLLKPASWLTEDELGAPQKGSPCGPGDARPFIGDDVQPVPASDAVTSFRAGETITVQWEETVYHPGYYRIALARTSPAAATSTHFADPPLIDPVECTYDEAAVRTGAHDDVLADGLFKADEQFSENRTLTHEVTLPDEPCDECTLQIVQVMKKHGASSCFYFHCAAIEILPADEGSPDRDAAAATGGRASAGAGGKDASGPATDADDGGCSVVAPGTRGSSAAAWCLLAIGLGYRSLTRRATVRAAGRTSSSGRRASRG
jgi:hypothetical protein